MTWRARRAVPLPGRDESRPYIPGNHRGLPLRGDLTFRLVGVSEQVLQSRTNLGNMLGAISE